MFQRLGISESRPFFGGTLGVQNFRVEGFGATLGIRAF